MKKIILAALTLVPALALATPGAYVQAQAGANFVDPNISGVSTSSGFAGGLGAGYLWGDNAFNYGVELDGLSYPNSTTTDHGVHSKYDGYNISLLGVLKYTSCSTGFVAFGKAGAAYVHQKVTVANISASGNDIDPEVALGVGYQFNPNWEMDLTADEVFGQTGTQTASSFKPVRNGSLTLGLAYHFA